MDDRPPARRDLDRMAHAVQSRWTGGLSLSTLALAAMDWAVHLVDSPGRQMQLMLRAGEQAARLALYAGRHVAEPDPPPCVHPSPGDRRFDDPE